MSLQCRASHIRALLAESPWQLQRLAGSWTRLPSSSSVESDGFDQLSASWGRLCSSPCSALHWRETAHTRTHTLHSSNGRHLINVMKRLRINLSVALPGSAWRDIFHPWVHLASTDRRLRLKCLLVCSSATLWFTGTASKILMFGHELPQTVNSDVWWISSHRAAEYRLENPWKQPLEDASFSPLAWNPCVFTAGCRDSETSNVTMK